MFELRQTPVFEKWFLRLKDRKARAKIAKRLTFLETGHFGDAKPVGDSVTELRIHFGPGYRIYVTKKGEQIIVLLCGGDKSSQQRDIDRAKALVLEIDDENDKV